MKFNGFFITIICLCACILSVLGVVGFVAAPKDVDYYYISHGSGSNGANTNACVYAHWTWHPDELAYCTDDAQKALDFVTKANSIATRRDK